MSDAVSDAIAVVGVDEPGFREKAKPKPLPTNMFLFTCECGGSHYRHAGYVKTFLPFLKEDGTKELLSDSRQVMVCVKCRRCYAWIAGQMYDITGHIDLNAWEKSEIELHKTTGPGGEC